MKGVGINNIQGVQELIANGIDVNECLEDQLTALHLAAGNGYNEIMKLLIYNGAQIDVKDKNGCLPIHYAALLNRIESVKLLIENGTNIHEVSTKGTPLELAVLRSNTETIRLLIEHKADVNKAIFVIFAKNDIKVWNVFLRLECM